MYPAITLTTSEALPATSGSSEPEGLTTLRRQLALAEGRVREQIAALDAVSWRFDRFYDGTFGYLGGFGGGYPADRADDRTHAALPYLTEEEWRLHLSLVREMAQRNHLLIGFRDHVKAFIGPVSVQFVLRGQAPGSTASGPVDADGDGQTDVDPLVRTVQEAWDEWCEVNDWGQGETDREEECIGRSILEGEATLEFFRGGRGEVPVCRHVEPELIRTPDEVPRDFDWASLEDWKWGALTKPHDAETVPAIYVAHPDRDGGRVIPANRFVRTKHNVDRVVKRGMSDFRPVAELVRKVAGLLENMGHVARLQAAIAWWEEYANTTEDNLRRHIETNRDYQGLRLGGPGQGSNAARVDVKNYDAGSIIRTEAGRNVQVGPTSQPNGFVQVEQAIMRSISFRFGLPSSFSGEADSFASSLVSGSPFVRIIEGRQKKQQGFTRSVIERVILLCEESGRLPQGTWRRVKPVLTSKPVVIADEEKKARTFLALLDKGVADPYKWMSAAGDDPKVLLANLASHKKKLTEMGGLPAPVPAPTAGPKDPTPTPPGSAGGDGTSPDDGGIFGEAILKEGFTGTIKDAKGRERHYVDGKQVAKAPDQSTESDPFSATKAAISQATDPVAKDYLESALFNATDGDARDLAQELASVWMHAHDLGHVEAQAAIERVLPITGAATTGPKKGEPVKHSGALYYAPAGMFPGDTGVVVRPPVVLPDGKVLVKGQVAPAKKESAPIKAIVWEDRIIDVHLSNGTTYQRRVKGNGPSDAAAPDRAHELHDDDRASITAGIDKDIAALPADKRPPAGTVARVKDLALTAAVKAYEWSIRLSPAAERIGGILGAILDTPGDMKLLGYNPNLSSGTANPKTADAVSSNLNDALGFGISGHLVASIASKVIVKAAYWAAHKVRGEAVDTDDGFGVWAAMIAELFTHLNEQLSVERAAPDAATVEQRLRELVKGMS